MTGTLSNEMRIRDARNLWDDLPVGARIAIVQPNIIHVLRAYKTDTEEILAHLIGSHIVMCDIDDMNATEFAIFSKVVERYEKSSEVAKE